MGHSSSDTMTFKVTYFWKIIKFHLFLICVPKCKKMLQAFTNRKRVEQIHWWWQLGPVQALHFYLDEFNSIDFQITEDQPLNLFSNLCRYF